jgi:hypothetical protein
VKLIEDLVQPGKNILLLGRPGIGKTTMLREVARVLADDLKKRVIIVDTSNEIAGDGDVPHPAIGHARRMQVPTPAQQHAVMIEAVENHMPEAIIIDEIGTELEAAAARTIAERGVQLIGTAHGNTLENLILNPILADLVGGLQAVTLGDEEARRRGTQKSILERKAPPTFDVVVEIQEFNKVAIHPDVTEVVDAILRGHPLMAEIRWLDEKQEVQKISPPPQIATGNGSSSRSKSRPQSLYPFGINRFKLQKAIREKQLPVNIVDELKEAEMVITSQNYYLRKSQKLRDAEAAGLSTYVLKSNANSHIRQFLDTVYADGGRTERLQTALEEAEEAAIQVISRKEAIELSPQSAYVRRLQHLLAERHHLLSYSVGKEPHRRVKIFKGEV